MNQKEIKQKAEKYITRIKTEFFLDNNQLKLIKQGYIDGLKDATKEMREEVINIFTNGMDNECEVWKACGLRLVG